MNRAVRWWSVIPCLALIPLTLIMLVLSPGVGESASIPSAPMKAQKESGAQATQPIMNFVGSGVTVANDTVNNQIDVTIPATLAGYCDPVAKGALFTDTATTIDNAYITTHTELYPQGTWSGGGSYALYDRVKDDGTTNVYVATVAGGQAEDPSADTNNTYWKLLHAAGDTLDHTWIQYCLSGTENSAWPPGVARVSDTRPLVIYRNATSVQGSGWGNLTSMLNNTTLRQHSETGDVLVIASDQYPTVRDFNIFTYYQSLSTTPVNAAFSTASSGGSLANSTTYWYRVTALNGAGETLPSTQTSITTGVSGSNHTVTVNWNAVNGATGYRVYCRTSGAQQLCATVGAVTTWDDTGSVTPSGALPTVNSTGPKSGAGIRIDNLGFDVNRAPANANVQGTTIERVNITGTWNGITVLNSTGHGSVHEVVLDENYGGAVLINGAQYRGDGQWRNVFVDLDNDLKTTLLQTPCIKIILGEQFHFHYLKCLDTFHGVVFDPTIVQGVINMIFIDTSFESIYGSSFLANETTHVVDGLQIIGSRTATISASNAQHIAVDLQGVSRVRLVGMDLGVNEKAGCIRLLGTDITMTGNTIGQYFCQQAGEGTTNQMLVKNGTSRLTVIGNTFLASTSTGDLSHIKIENGVTDFTIQGNTFGGGPYGSFVPIDDLSAATAVKTVTGNVYVGDYDRSYAMIPDGQGSTLSMGTGTLTTPGADVVQNFERHTTTADAAGVNIISGTAGESYLGFGDTAAQSDAEIRYSNSTGNLSLRVRSSAKYWAIDPNGYLSYGGATAEIPLHIDAVTGTGTFLSRSYGLANITYLQRSEGTFASKTAITSGLTLGAFEFGGWDGSAWVNGGRINTLATENWSGTARGTAIRLFTTPDGSTTLTERVRLTAPGNLKVAGTAVRATTEGTNHLDIFDGTAPVGTLTNGISLYSTAGELRVMDAAGNATLLSPHNDVGEWVFYSKNTVTGRVIEIDMERMMKRLDTLLGHGYIRERVEAVQ